MNDLRNVRHARFDLRTLGVYVAALFFLLFFALGQRSLSGSEDRWGEIARNMVLHGDWVHPVINGEVYFDKPLLSYWLIAIVAKLSTLSEFTVRVPGAFSALLAMFCTYRIGVERFDGRVAGLSVALMATSYGFLFWSHTASAELSNLALITAAVAWFVTRRERADLVSYLGFYLICAVGCQLKGLTAIAVPALVVLADILSGQRWRRHLNGRHVLAIVLSLGVFFVPYLLSASHPLPNGVQAQHNHLSGIDLLIRENIVRFFEPFDHRDPFYSYLFEVPKILLPWAFIFVAAVWHYVRRYRQLDDSRRWLLNAILVIFLFFTLSGSRRWYYILPIVPFCALLTADDLLADRMSKARRWASSATVLSLSLGAILLALVPWATKAYLKGIPLSPEFYEGAVLGTVALLSLVAYRRLPFDAWFPACPSWPKLMPVLLLVTALEMVAVFCFMLPGADRYRQLKPFIGALQHSVRPDERIVFFQQTNTAMAFYLNHREPIAIVHTRSDLPPSAAGWVLLSERDDLERLYAAFPELRREAPVLKESSLLSNVLFENAGLIAYRLSRR